MTASKKEEPSVGDIAASTLHCVQQGNLTPEQAREAVARFRAKHGYSWVDLAFGNTYRRDSGVFKKA